MAGSEALLPVIVVGGPLRAEGGLFNTAVVIHRGRLLGVVPKRYLVEYREYYEKRQFRAARNEVGDQLKSLDATVPFGADLLLAPGLPEPRVLDVDICEDLWVRIPPGTYTAMPLPPSSRTCPRATSGSGSGLSPSPL